MAKKKTSAENTDRICRAITFPIVADSPADWKELDPLFKYAWGMSTHLANWAMSELFMADQLTLDRQAEKLAPMPYFYLYGLFVRCYPRYDDWAGATAQASSILNAIEKKYKAKRLDILWRGSSSLPSFRYPYPFPVHNRSWKPFFNEGHAPCVSAGLPGGRIHFRLRGGPEMRRQLRLFEQLVQGVKRGEMALYRQGKHILAKLIGWFAVESPRQTQERTMLVRTDPHALWVCEIEGTQPRVWNQDHIRARVESHRIFRQRLSEDMKHEKRVPRKMKKHMLHTLEDRCRKHNDRLKTFCHEMSKQLAEFAVRQKVHTVLYRDDNKSWLPLFPWHQLKTKLIYKLEERSIACITTTEGASDPEVANENGEG